MISKADGVIEQSGVIPYRIKNGKIEVLLITSSTGKRWVIPKGMIEFMMSPQDSAAKEAWEEAGVIGQVLPTTMGTYDYQKWGRTCRVETFLLQVETVLEDWPEAKLRKREWLSVKQAVKHIQEAELKQILMALPDTLLTLQSPPE
ncbi:NUDIX hydrolase [Funiculus sociatus GB2-A5]|uniref:NUDIX hydrolase n=1 Tax=Funiculus sociatus GB2-A5 TaxID=2933946 RepID=A0ABV0JJ07_9CYAN|nr:MULTISPECIES: NUDIX hydrolase [unclassified Trichocoleus]MBD1907326.1 NUDIX hydrolase [Trichocoleus sp. FACHB-832]MBD2062556.1 NUDIX hydrolase [Trichocoleus sp. FACHB-6]